MTSLLRMSGVEFAQGKFQLRANFESTLGCLGLFGPSGSGKTTLLEIIAGLRRPRTGRVEWGGTILDDPATGSHQPPHRRSIGYVPQDLALFPHLNVRGNINYGRREGDGAPLAEILEVLELLPLLDRRVGDLSGGERRRVAIARALAARPQLLLLDEPLTGLDARRQDNVLQHLLLLRQRWAIPMLYVSHQAEDVMVLCDAVVVLRDGEIQAHGPPDDIFEPAGRPTYRLRDPL